MGTISSTRPSRSAASASQVVSRTCRSKKVLADERELFKTTVRAEKRSELALQLSQYYEGVRAESLARPEPPEHVIISFRQRSFPFNLPRMPRKVRNWPREYRRPDEALLSDLASRAGLGFRGLVLLRSPIPDWIAANCVRRHFEGCRSQARTMEINALAIKAQMLAVGPERFKCVEYGDVDSMAEGLEWALGNTAVVRNTVAEMWHPSSLGNASSERRATTKNDGMLEDLAKKHLEAPIAAIRELCSRGQ